MKVRLRYFLFTLHVLVMACLVTAAQAADVTLAWDAPITEDGKLHPGLAGYKLHYGPTSKGSQNDPEQFQYTQTAPEERLISVESTEKTPPYTTTYTIAGLTEGQTYYVAVTAYDSQGKSSLYSDDEVSVFFPVPNVPPVARLAVSPATGAAPLPVTWNGANSSDADGQIVSYAWNFGDGAQAAGKTVAHTYTAAGDYQASLTVTDDQGATHIAHRTLTVQPAPSPSTPTPSPSTPAPSPSTPAPVGNLVPTGDMEQGIWKRGAFSGTNPKSTWATDSHHSGTHALKMTANGYFYGYWQAPDVPVTPGTAYRASMWLRTQAITHGVTLNISWRNASGRQVGWDSGIGGKVKGMHDWHEVQGEVQAPANATKARIQIRVQSNKGTAWIDDVALALVNGDTSSPDPSPAPNVSPVARLAVSPTTGAAPLQVTWNGANSSDADGQIVLYAWNFGDGAQATGTTVAHTYTAAGDYRASLTVTDDQGAAHTAHRRLTVQPAPSPSTPAPSPPTPAPVGSLVPTGDMEQGIWKRGAFSGTNPKSTWTTDSHHSGTHALKMTANRYFYGYWQAPDVPVTPGTAYRASMWLRSEAITHGVTLNISWRNASGRQVRWDTGIGGKVKGTHDWHEVQGEVQAPTNATKARIQIRVQSNKGTAWVDDVALALAGAPQAPPAAAAPPEAPAAEPTNTEAGESAVSESKVTQAVHNQRWEATLKSTVNYANPFKDVDVRVEYTKTGGNPVTLQGFGFWDGGSTFKMRQAFPEAGTWTYKTTASDTTNAGLHQQTGTVEVSPYTGTNPLYKHGFLGVSANKRYFEHADGTPFLWVGETLWGATMWLSEAGFQKAIDARRAQSFTVLQTNFARKAEVDTKGDTPWDAVNKRWNVDFMRKVDRMFNYANDKGMYLFINGLVDLFWDRNIREYKRLVEMIAIRYGAHHLSYSSSMDDPYNRIHDEINEIVDGVTNRHLLTQHPGSATDGSQNVGTAEQYYDKGYQDYVMIATGGVGNLERGCQRAIEWSLQLYDRANPKPVVNGETWYDGYFGGTGEITAHLAYLSLLSGQFGYTYGTDLWNAKDADLPVWQNYVGTEYMRNLYDLFITLDEGRPLVPRHDLVKNQKAKYSEKMVVGVSEDGKTYAAFLPQGGSIDLDLTELPGTASFAWYHTLDGDYAGNGTTTGGSIQTFESPFGNAQAVLVIVVN